MAMNFWDFLILLVVAGVCGGVAQALVGFSRGGCFVSIAVGFVGALLGMWFQKLAGVPELLVIEVGDTKFPIVWSIIGGVVFVAVVALISPRRPTVA
jgi:uncharacterized membrane protein YeaQ/YmgE (transglycosylase-associated protein family)